MAKYNGSGWHFQHTRHSNARKYGRAGGKYASYSNDKEGKDPINKKTAIRYFREGIPFYAHIKGKKHYGEGDYEYEDEPRRNYHYGKIITNNIKGGLADNVNPKYFNQLELAKGIKVEMEHTNNPSLAREIATDHLAEQPDYYEKLEKVEGKVEPIKVKISHKEIRRDKNNIEKDLLKGIQETSNPEEKKRLEHMYRELRKADNHSKLKRFYEEYGYTLKTLGIAIPFYFLAPLVTAGIILGATITKDVPMDMLALRMAFPLTTSMIGTMGVKYSVRTLQAIKKREKEIIAEKSKELQDNTTLPPKEIKVIAKRVAQQELKNTKLVTELSA